MPPKKRGRAGNVMSTPAPDSSSKFATPKAQTSPHHAPEDDDDDDDAQETPRSITKGRGKTTQASAASTRSKRGGADVESPKMATDQKRAGAKPTSFIEKDVKKRGRPARAKAEEVIEEAAEELLKPETVEPARKRGRPSKKTSASEEEDVEEGAEEVKEPPRKRGRPAKPVSAASAVKDADSGPARGRGRPAKGTGPTKAKPAKKVPAIGERRSVRQAMDESEDIVELQQTRKHGAANNEQTQYKKPDASSDEEEEAAPASKPRGRGRKPAAKSTVESKEAAPKKGRGRPRKTDSAADDVDAAPKKGRGRPKNVSAGAASAPAKPAGKKRGRPAGKAKKAEVEEEEVDEEEEDEAEEEEEDDGHPKHAHYHEAMDRVNDQVEEELADAVSDASPASEKKTSKRKATAGPAAKATKKSKKASDAEDDTADGPHYWLMKAEPNTRIEKNADGEDVDVKFSIEDLRSKTTPEPWEGESIKSDNLPNSDRKMPGIRNGQAQNNLKAMKKGDLAFFYESNCKVPGIVGIMEIVEEASPDPAAWDRKSAYYDGKTNSDKPRWMLVHVQFKTKFPEKVTLKELQKFSKSGDALENMGLIKQSRLSVSKVSKAEWDFVMEQVKDGGDVEENNASEGRDLGNDFARAFEAPANFETTEEKEDQAMPDAAEPDESTAETKNGGGLFSTITSAFRLGRSPDPTPTLGQATETVEQAAEAAAETVSDAVQSVLPDSAQPIKKTTARAASKTRKAASAVKSSSRAASARAGSKTRELGSGVESAFKAQTDTILEGADGEEGDVEQPAGGDAVSGAGSTAPLADQDRAGGMGVEEYAHQEEEDEDDYNRSVDIGSMEFT